MTPRRRPAARVPAKRLRALLKKLPGASVLVVGDIILDEYLIGDAKRLSPEAPIPVVELKQETVTPGAAAYVASLIQHLGGHVYLCGVIGDDANGMRLRALLRSSGIDTTGLVTDATRPTTIKTRVIARHQQMLRIDRECLHPIPLRLSQRLLAFIQATIPAVDAVVFSDYDKGTFTPGLIRGAILAARRAGRAVAVNPKPHLALNFRGATVVSMNQEEASACLKRALPDEQALVRGAMELRRRLQAQGTLITRHQHGMVLATSAGASFIPVRAKEVFDGTGAGDTVIALAGLGLAAGGRLADCVHLANIAAGVEVGKLGCALVSQKEISRGM